MGVCWRTRTATANMSQTEWEALQLGLNNLRSPRDPQVFEVTFMICLWSLQQSGIWLFTNYKITLIKLWVKRLGVVADYVWDPAFLSMHFLLSHTPVLKEISNQEGFDVAMWPWLVLVSSQTCFVNSLFQCLLSFQGPLMLMTSCS